MAYAIQSVVTGELLSSCKTWDGYAKGCRDHRNAMKFENLADALRLAGNQDNVFYSKIIEVPDPVNYND